MSYKKEFRHITTFVFDVDGVFTDGGITIFPDETSTSVSPLIKSFTGPDGIIEYGEIHTTAAPFGQQISLLLME
jgi:3-deoxy-D-manno-octulosonate 8-phosphate phosphatase KdsC-like HAD superfamily phosphatase